MVSSFDFNCMTDHVGVMRRSVAKPGSASTEAGVDIMTEMSIGVGLNSDAMRRVLKEGGE